jgi:hypothetical protein
MLVDCKWDEASVYQIKNLTTGRRYIGVSHGIRDRYLSHRRPLQLGKHPNLALQRDWNAGHRFVMAVLEHVPDSERSRAESLYIMKSRDLPGGVYNLDRMYVTRPDDLSWSAADLMDQSVEDRAAEEA